MEPKKQINRFAKIGNTYFIAFLVAIGFTFLLSVIIEVLDLYNSCPGESIFLETAGIPIDPFYCLPKPIEIILKVMPWVIIALCILSFLYSVRGIQDSLNKKEGGSRRAIFIAICTLIIFGISLGFYIDYASRRLIDDCGSVYGITCPI